MHAELGHLSEPCPLYLEDSVEHTHRPQGRLPQASAQAVWGQVLH